MFAELFSAAIEISSRCGMAAAADAQRRATHHAQKHSGIEQQAARQRAAREYEEALRRQQAADAQGGLIIEADYTVLPTPPQLTHQP